jgi:hypothetical protein
LTYIVTTQTNDQNDTTNTNPDSAKKYAGHGRTKFINTIPQHKYKIAKLHDDDSSARTTTATDKHAKRLRQQATRLTQWASRIHVLHEGSCNSAQSTKLHELNRIAERYTLQHLDPTQDDEATLQQRIRHTHHHTYNTTSSP